MKEKERESFDVFIKFIDDSTKRIPDVLHVDAGEFYIQLERVDGFSLFNKDMIVSVESIKT